LPFVETDGSLPWSQEPPTRPFPETNRMHSTFLNLLNIRFNIILCLCLNLQSCLFPSGFPAKMLNHFASPACVLHALSHRP